MEKLKVKSLVIRKGIKMRGAKKIKNESIEREEKMKLKVLKRVQLLKNMVRLWDPRTLPIAPLTATKNRS